MTVSSPKVVFLTGAGLSADSGVPTFHGDNGFYDGINAEQVLSYRTMRQSPEVVHRFTDDMRSRMGAAEPNAAHRMIARLGNEFGDSVVHLTQNIDPFVEDAGFTGTIHLHGLITRMRSIGNSKVTEDIGFKRYWSGADADAPARGFQFRCPKTGSLFRPDIVLFDEFGPHYSKLVKLAKRLRPQDTFVLIGTQANIHPISMAMKFALQTQACSILNNLHSGPNVPEGSFDHVFMEQAVTAASRIEEIVRERLKQ